MVGINEGTHESGEATLKFHEGQALMRLASGIYLTLHEAIFEAVQNSIDARATLIEVMIHRKDRVLIISDNGDGVSPVGLNEALSSIALSIKPKGKYGRYGLGFISMLGKCKWHKFTSVTKGNSYHEWLFNPVQLEKKSSGLTIPCKKRDDLIFDGKLSKSREERSEKGRIYVPWRSQLVAYDYTADALMGRIDINELRDGIVDRYAIGMREQGTVVRIVDIPPERDAAAIRIEARATEFLGKPLKEEHFPRKSTRSETILRLFFRDSGSSGRKAKILFGEMGDKFRIRHDQFIMSARGILDEEVAKAFVLGIFEGEITTSMATLNPNRRGFNKDDGLVTFCLHLADWYEEVAKPIIEELQDKTRNVRHTEVGVTVLDWAAQLLKQPEWSSIYSLFSKGSIGEGHSVKGTKGETSKPEIAISGGALRDRKDGESVSEDGELKKDEMPKAERKAHNPATVESEELGKVRSLVKNDSLGLTIGHSNMFGDMRAYVFDEERGRLIFNTSHPMFVRCDEAGPMKLARYEQFVLMSIIVLRGQPEDVRHLYTKGLEDLLKMEVFRILSDPMILRSRKR